MKKPNNTMVYTVSKLNAHLSALVDSDEMLQTITLRGEISNFTNHFKTGHFYFALKDAQCSIKVVMFQTYAKGVRFAPENGMEVVITGAVRCFVRDGALQFYCKTMQPDGMGAMALGFEQLKTKLAALGLFDEAHKKPIPAFPSVVGVLTSKTGAALSDILTVLERRYPLVKVKLFSVLVQGELAPASICAAIKAAQTQLKNKPDVLIVGRGGGSSEDLWCFNDESVARAIYDCEIPIVSAVGHEIDFTIADFVADLRAPTPTAAAELCTPDQENLRYLIGNYQALLQKQVHYKLSRQAEQLHRLTQRLATLSPRQKISHAQQMLQGLTRRLQASVRSRVLHHSERFASELALLEALNPMQVLLRGYTVNYRGEEIVTSVEMLQKGDSLCTMLQDGKVISIVQALEKNTEKGVLHGGR